jgi:aspartyl-tRNA(Asn)/glutamyl-tRNA(Gln) amidotransferase subunit C
MPIPPEEVRRIAALANLEFTEEEIGRFSRDLSRILEYIDQLKEVDTDKIEPLIHVFDRQGQGRPDQVGACLPVQEALRNAPQRQDVLFKVPRVVT